MTTTADPPSLARLEALHSGADARPSERRARPSMGYLPGLDGLRAVSVIAVMLYHLHALDPTSLGSFRGGFFGVEVFFVVSGFLITSLLIEEHQRAGHVDFRQFWLRRARRLLPALYAMLVVVGIWAALWRPDTVARLRTDLPGALFYYSNWLQIFDDVGYFAALDTPPLLRHLWSLAVEEQWYLVWPPVFALLVRAVGDRPRRLLLPVLGMAAVSVLAMVLLYSPDDAGRANFLYLGTVTRASGLLLGAALATRWQPWRWSGANRRHLVGLDVIGFGAIAGLGAAVVFLDNESSAVYRGGFLLVSTLSAVAIAAVAHPGARAMRQVFGSAPLVQIGKRSYGLYLWHWPVFVLTRAASGAGRLAFAVVVTAVLSEACYRFVEEPVRKGALRRWFGERSSAFGDARRRMTVSTVLYGLAAAALVVPLAVRVVTADEHNIALDESGDVAFDLPTAVATTIPDDSPTAGDRTPTVATSTTLATLPRRLTIVGDSQAHSLAINLPAGIESTFTISDGSVEGCGVWDEGTVITEREGFSRTFDECSGWAQEWGAAAMAADAEVALVVIGAWDVFDVQTDAGVVAFDTPGGDARFLGLLRQGIGELSSAGAKVALLEVPCMRPTDAAGAGVPPLPERADDDRVAHLNTLLRQAADENPRDVVFVPGPTEWCDDPSISTDLNYRWDGIHVYKPGAELIYETIAPTLLRVPV
ncbi:MAG: acyltransferase family protein [Acidimicrobiia bacterium]